MAKQKILGTFLRTLQYLSLNCVVVASAAWAECDFDRDILLSLSQHEFDQNPDNGWRLLAKQPDCEAQAADLIAAFREKHQSSDGILFWHEGQLRATINQTEQALQLFSQSRKPAGQDIFGWNLYVDATIAFLRQDKASLLQARESLARLPKPADLNLSDDKGNPVDIPWPLNLDVVDRLVACFGQSYTTAYGYCESAREKP